MLASRIKRRADQGVRATKRLRVIAGEIISLPDEDLLDLADIFTNVTGSAISELARAEMTNRGISL
jgi:hypothetical protein